MKLFTYIFRNVTRNKLRSSLTILSVGFSLALMTILYGYLAMQKVAEREAEKHDRLAVLNKLGFAGLLPISHVDKVRKMDGVAAAIPFSWFGGNYKGQQMPFAQFATEPKYAFDVFNEYQIDQEQLEEFKSDRQACVADKGLAEQMNWEIGERIPLEGTIYTQDLDLRLVGTFEAPGNTGSLWFNWNYLDEELRKSAPGFPSNAGMIYVKCKVSDEVAIVSEEIDAAFANSENSTRTRTEAAFQNMFADMLGDVQTYIRYISMAVVFALALVAATAMSMSMRERTTEVAVFKAIGFSNAKGAGAGASGVVVDRDPGRTVGNCGRLGCAADAVKRTGRGSAVSNPRDRVHRTLARGSFRGRGRHRLCQRIGTCRIRPHSYRLSMVSVASFEIRN